jgi:hypothetical protein
MNINEEVIKSGKMIEFNRADRTENGKKRYVKNGKAGWLSNRKY